VGIPIVVCERFTDSTVAYQGRGGALGAAWIQRTDEALTGSFRPDLTLLLDLDPEFALQRAEGWDRFEIRDLAFHRSVRRGFLALAREEPKRIRVVPAGGTAAEVFARVRGEVEAFLQAPKRRARRSRARRSG